MISDYPREDNGYANFLGQTRCIMVVNTRKQEANESHFGYHRHTNISYFLRPSADTSRPGKRTSMEEILKQKAKEAIDSYSDELYGLSKRIWEKPELNFQEKYAHDQLTEYLAARGFDVTPHYTLDTAFRAETGEDGGLTVGLICEYDALPEVGHACGHNLIAESGVAAAVGISLDLMNRIVRPSLE